MRPGRTALGSPNVAPKHVRYNPAGRGFDKGWQRDSKSGLEASTASHRSGNRACLGALWELTVDLELSKHTVRISATNCWQAIRIAVQYCLHK